MTDTPDLQGLVERGRALLSQIDQLSGNVALYNLGKMVADDDTYDTLEYLERESKKTRLSYHTIHASVHKRWADWANEAERAMLQTKGTRSELNRFRKLRDQVNGLYSRRAIDLPSISQKVKEQVAIAERLPDLTVAKPTLSVGRVRRSSPRTRRIERIVRRLEKNPYVKFSIIVGTIAGSIYGIVQLIFLLA